MITYIDANGRYRSGNGIDYGYPLPPDFPAREPLVTAGYVYTEQVRRATDEALLAVAGVGKVTLTRIREALTHV